MTRGQNLRNPELSVKNALVNLWRPLTLIGQKQVALSHCTHVAMVSAPAASFGPVSSTMHCTTNECCEPGGRWKRGRANAAKAQDPPRANGEDAAKDRARRHITAKALATLRQPSNKNRRPQKTCEPTGDERAIRISRNVEICFVCFQGLEMHACFSFCITMPCDCL